MKRTSVFILFILTLPILVLINILIKLNSKGPVIFKQKRLGKNKKVFTMYKFRTMVENAEELKTQYKKLNEASGPVFKIYDDPRFTKVGKLLSRIGLDELPQLINIIRGEMDFVGPRPLPIDEAKKVPEKYHKRFSVLPGLTSPWVLRGTHKLTFDQWMKSDLWYVDHKSFWLDIKISILTVWLIISWSVKRLFK